MYNCGDFTGTETVTIPVNAFSSNDPSESITVSNLANTDVYVYKDASLTQRTSFLGIAVDIDVDGIAGSHWVTLDLTNNDDAGFYSAGSRFIVRIEGVTVDGGTVNAWIGGFSIGVNSAVVTAALVAHNLDHLALTPTAAADMTAEVADNTILARMLANGDTSVFVPSTDGLQPTRDHIGNGANLTEAGGTGNHLTHVPYNSAWDADIQSECADALAAIHLDHLLAADYDPAAKPGAATALLNELIENDAGVSRYTTNALEQGRGTNSAATEAKQDIIDTNVDQIETAVITNAAGTDVAADIIALKAVADGIPTTAMRGTDSAATEAKQDIIDTNVDQLETAIITNAAGVDVAADIIAVKAVVDGIPTTAMRGTDSAALASVATEGRLAELDAANLPTDIAAIPTTAMRGTDNAALASVATEARLAELDAANLPTDVAAIPTTAMRGTDSAATEAKQDTIDTVVDAIKAVTDALPDAGALTTIGTNAARLTAARAAVLTDLINGGRLDLLIDAIKAKTDNLPEGVKKNTALLNFPVVMVLTNDHVTPATGKTVTGQRSIDGGAFASVTGAIAEISNGLYQFDAAAADTNGNIIVWRFSETDCDDTWVHIKTEE